MRCDGMADGNAQSAKPGCASLVSRRAVRRAIGDWMSGFGGAEEFSNIRRTQTAFCGSASWK